MWSGTCPREAENNGLRNGTRFGLPDGVVRSASRVAVTCLLIVLSPAPARAAAGDLDATFGDGGTLVTELPGIRSDGRDVAIQSDGKVVVAANGYPFPFLRADGVRRRIEMTLM